MKSATAITYELDDISAAVAELCGQVRKKIDLEENSIGILYGQPDMELGELASSLNRELGITIMGGTTAGAAMLLNDGHHELAVTLHVMTATDCYFASSISPSLDTTPRELIVDTYNKALAKLRTLGLEPKFVFCATSILQSISSDDCLSVLSEAADGLPIFGFVAADDFEFSKQQVFLNGEIGGDRMAVLLIAGEIQPVFEVRNLADAQPLSKRRVTKANGNIIREIDGKPAYEYIKEFPFIGEETGILWNYQFFVEMENESDNDGVLISRALNSYSKESGEISCFADVPQGSNIGLLYCDGTDVKATCKKALNSLRAKIDSRGGYQYSTVFIASCSLRNMFLADEKAAEGDLVKEIVPAGITASGVYAFGEIAPTSIRNGKAVNRFHNATITICAL